MKIIYDRDAHTYSKALQETDLLSVRSRVVREAFVEQILDELRAELMRLKCTVGYPISDIGKADASKWDGGYCIHEEDGYWLVYHSERGLRGIPDIFSGVQNAANYFLWIHVANPSARNTDVGMLPILKG